MSQSVAVLGATGMLGSMVLDVLSRESNLDVMCTVHSVSKLGELAHKYPHVKAEIYDVEEHWPAKARDIAQRFQWVVNCIGITKPHIHENVPAEVERAIQVNALWPHLLAREVSEAGGRLLQIATDCVFSGHSGPYAEPSTPDAHDVYGRTKSLGETRYPGVTNLRNSIIGPEQGASKFLLDWVRRQPGHADIRGYVDHYWNGITTLQFAKICRGIIQTQRALPTLVHVVPKDVVSKFQLVTAIAKAYGRGDIQITPHQTPHANMVLATHQPEVVAGLWAAAGYSAIPTVEDMVNEVAQYTFQFDHVVKE